MLIRTIEQAYDELKKRDPETAITKNLVRELIKQDKVPCIQAGKKRLVDVDVLEQYVSDITRGVV